MKPFGFTAADSISNDEQLLLAQENVSRKSIKYKKMFPRLSCPNVGQCMPRESVTEENMTSRGSIGLPYSYVKKFWHDQEITN